MTTSPSSPVERIILEYRERVLGYIAGKNVPISDREDVFGEILLKAQRQAGRYDSARASVSTWVYMITRSVVADYYKKRKQEYPLSEVLASDDSVEDGIEYQEELRQLAQQLNRLPEMERRVVILRLYKEMSHAGIAQALGISETNARTIYSRAVGRLRKRMDGGKQIAVSNK